MSKQAKRCKRDPRTWTAAAAAGEAVHKAEEFVDRYEHNPFLISHGAMHTGQVIDTYLRFFAEEGLRDRRAALRLALFQLGIDLPVDTRDLVQAIARRHVEEEVAAVRKAETYVVSPGMHAVAVAAAESLGQVDFVMAREDDIPAPSGFVLLPHIQLVQKAHQDQPSEIRALVWWLATVPNLEGRLLRVVKVVTLLAADGPMQFPEFTSTRRAAKDAGHPFPSLIPDHRPFMTLDGDQVSDAEVNEIIDAQRKLYGSVVQHRLPEDGQLVGQYTGELLCDDNGTFELRYLFAFWRLCAQRIATISQYRELAGDGEPPVTPRVHDVRVTQLRTFSPLQVDGENHRRHYRHHWVIRMHKVRQWYPKEGVHRVLWPGPYIKGPDGAPLLSGAKVNALVR
jgi:hypothetical protein